MNCKKKIALLLLFFALFSPSFPDSAVFARDLSQSVKELIEGFQEHDCFWVGCEKIYAGRELVEFYRMRFFQPLWVEDKGPTQWARELADTIYDAESHGLVPEDYHANCIRQWLQSLDQRAKGATPAAGKELARLEIVLTDAFLNFGSHLSDGKVDPERIYPEWLSGKEHQADVFEALHHVEDQESVSSALKRLSPPHSDYWGLVREARWLQTVEKAGGWPVLEKGDKIEPGDRDPRVANLARRLELQGYLPHGFAADNDLYDKTLENAVKKFQANHGLEIDGVIGKNTLRELNVQPGQRRIQILANLERWRWLPRFLGQKHIRVNTAAFQLEAVEDEEVKLEMRVIVGKDFQKTPVFSKRMRYLEINPFWNVPKSIFKKELIYDLKKDPELLAKDHYEIVTGWGDDSPALDPATIDWSRVNAATFPGRVRQKPGPWNALGRIKFMFPNQFHVYMHDTPSRRLFRKAHRALSHGCIRLEKPVDLAVFVLKDNPTWNRKKIEKAIQDGKRKIVGVPGKITVHLMYFTSWMEENGEAQFRRDIYERDSVLWEALNRSANGAPFAPVMEDALFEAVIGEQTDLSQ